MIVTLGDYAAHFATAGWALFAVLYGVFAPWWRSPIGRNLLVHAVVLAVTFALVSVSLLWGVTWPARDWVRLAIFMAVALVGWWRLAILLTDQVFVPRQTMPEAARRQGATHRECRECGK